VPSHTDEWIDLDDERHHGRVRARRLAYRTCTVLLVALVGGAVLETTGVAVYGVHTSTVEASSPDGWHLEVRYGDRSRPALATPFDIEVRHDGGFDGPVTVAVTSEYLAMWDENGLDPAPSEETSDAERTLWTFEPPDGDTLGVSFDARIEPAVQSGERGRVAVIDDATGEELVAVEFQTTVLP
jgi:hypothetical protein